MVLLVCNSVTPGNLKKVCLHRLSEFDASNGQSSPVHLTCQATPTSSHQAGARGEKVVSLPPTHCRTLTVTNVH